MQVPSVHDGDTPVPLVISLHGGGGSTYEGYWYFIGLTEQVGFALVAPGHDRYGAWMVWYEEEAIDLSAPKDPNTTGRRPVGLPTGRCAGARVSSESR